MRTHGAGRHEFGQNFLTDRRTITDFVGLVSRTEGPIVEIGPGSGALTMPMAALGRAVTAVEADGRLVALLRRQVPEHVRVVHGDFLRYRLPRSAHVVVGNLPFDRTTAMLRRLLHTGHWTDAVLLIQWEVARRRAGVGGATMMTAQWWPWYRFGLEGRVPASAFEPSPGVDGGLLTIARRERPLVDPGARSSYADLVHTVYTGKGRGIEQILTRMLRGRSRPVRRWLAEQRVRPTALPRDLTAAQWAALHEQIGTYR
ncbi:23S ribosomal RNA methyltransferase Erm [Nocardiopsis kunsanensis]|uniref:Ribosomal RNA adenine methylase transferase N-terminal domain-containing protein n=1 Tax=Nocardiopsis kunsanensis TaxID=141693 RepID=A0A919CH74_9ACTN|nr:23S ribosomal RNA methyltransferase Erm [Nocardiopsis kunsanensis]GHD25249.1 hypothetical protein GCM10007147_22290 [Nocardiopsis kunsanensis]